MGYNTVAFLLNDLMGSLEHSPKAVLFALTHPPMGSDKLSAESWRKQVDAVAVEAGEPRLHSQALEVLPTFHADWTQYLKVGGNCVQPMTEIVRYGKTKDGRRTITLVLP